MPTTYRIHPGLGIARLGNSPDAFCISPEQPAVLPLDCDGRGNPRLSPDGLDELPIQTFKDAEGRVKRQAARFQVWAYDDESPQGRPLKLGDAIEGGGNAGVLVDTSGASTSPTRRRRGTNSRSSTASMGTRPGTRGATRRSPIRRRASG